MENHQTIQIHVLFMEHVLLQIAVLVLLVIQELNAQFQVVLERIQQTQQFVHQKVLV
jgi:hypothetical protein